MNYINCSVMQNHTKFQYKRPNFYYLNFFRHSTHETFGFTIKKYQSY